MQNSIGDSPGVKIVSGANLISMLDCVGMTVGKATEVVSQIVNVPRSAIRFVNGRVSRVDRVLKAGDRLEFISNRVGVKGVGNRVWTASEYCEFFQVERATLLEQIESGLAVMRLGTGEVRITETAVDRFIHGESEADLSRNLKRIADHFDPPPPDIIGTPEVAKKISCTTVWVAKMAATGRIPANCIVAGSGNEKPWKFYRSRIEQWLESR